MNRWILTMIVKNEIKTLPRLWESVRSWIDGWVICDTGSQDGTIEFLESLKRENTIPGTYFQHEWRDFGHNRSLSFQMAKQWIQTEKTEWDLSSCWSLLMDADMVLCVGNGNPKSIMNSRIRGYEFIQKQGGMEYNNIRLIHLGSPWRCIGKTHEYWNYEISHQNQEIMKIVSKDILYIDDRGDGGSRGDKLPRDARLLKAQLEETPNDVRTWFYLAQTLQDMGKWRDAHAAYQRRIELGGWDEERWMAMMRQSICSYEGSKDSKQTSEEQQKLWGRCISEGVQAWAFRPTRAEPLYRLAHWTRVKGNHAESWAWIHLGQQISYPKHDKLFIEPHAYSDGWWDELSIIAYYMKDKIPSATQEGINALEKLFIGRYKSNIDSPEWRRRELARSNRKFYPFPNLTNQIIQMGEWNASVSQWNACNPSAVYHQNKWIVSVRNVNYRIVNGGYVYPTDTIPCIDTATQIKQFSIENETNLGWIPAISPEIRTNLDSKWKDKNKIPIWGMEDVRLFSYQNRIWFTSTCLHHTDFMGTPRIYLGKLKEDLSEPDPEHESVMLRVYDKQDQEILGWYKNGCEKNWLAFEHETKIHIIYSWEPFRVLVVENENTGVCRVIHEIYTPYYCGEWRGSTTPVFLSANTPSPKFAPLSAGFLTPISNINRYGCMIHEVTSVTNQDVSRNYFQRWVEFRFHNQTVEFTFVSSLFVITEQTIEFPLSCVPMNETQWFLTWGYKDGKARWAILQ